MRNILNSSFIIFLLVISLIPNLCLSRPIGIPEYRLNMSDEELVKEYEKYLWGYNPIKKKYIYDVLYVGMPEEEFVRKFTKGSSYEGTARPYISKKIKNSYYLTFPNEAYLAKDQYLLRRITFNNKKLIKIEYRYIDKFPFMWYAYHDETEELEGEPGR